MIARPTIPGLLIAGTDTGVGKTVIAAAIADWFRRTGRRVGVFKPFATGCVKRREGLVSEDAEFLAHCAGTRQPLDVICPQRFAEPLAPAVAAERAGQQIEWSAVQRALTMLCNSNDVLIVEGVGGVRVPIDEAHTFLDVAASLQLPAVVVSRPGLGTINHTLLTIDALRSAKVPLAGVVINRYPAENPGVAEETNPRAIEKWGKASILCTVGDYPRGIADQLPADIVRAIGTVDWQQFLVRRGS